MNKALPIIIVAVVGVGVLGIGGWVYLSRSQTGITPPIGESVQAPQEENEGFTGKLKDALQLGQSMKCTWKQDENNFATSHIKGDKIRTEMTYGGKVTHSIMKDNCTYTWEEGKTQGYKMCYEPGEVDVEEEMEAAEELSEEQVGIGMETPDYDYECVPAVIADSLFNPPATVNFISPQDILESMGQ